MALSMAVQTCLAVKLSLNESGAITIFIFTSYLKFEER
jgi:hypothetical protein